MLRIAIRDYRRRSFILVALILFILPVWPKVMEGNDQKRSGGHLNRYESGEEQDNYEDRKEQRLKKKHEGNELTGQSAAWLFVAANLTVVLSMLMKGVNRYFRLQPETKYAITRFNQFQKKHLMRFHYVLNPSALGIAGLHFLLSSCGKSSLPEWGLLFVTIMVFIGLMVKFKVTPKWVRGFVYRLHTSPAAFSALILMLFVGHLIVD